MKLRRKWTLKLRRDWTGPYSILAVLGAGSLIVAITGQALKASGFEFGFIESWIARLGLLILGCVLLGVSLLEGEETGRPPVGPKGSAPALSAESQRVRELQELLGLGGKNLDGLWGPVTRLRCMQQFVGSPNHVSSRMSDRLAGNRNRELVAWVQRQLNRKFDAGLRIDGIAGAATHEAIVGRLGETDGIVGPRGYRFLTLD